MSIAYCPDCDGKIVMNPEPRIGKKLICTHCNAELEVIDIDPVELDWVYEEFEDDWDDDEEE